VSTSGVPYLEVERYDRDLTADPIRRLHQEDICQALGRPSESKYQAEGGPSVVETVELLRRCSAVPAQDLPASGGPAMTINGARQLSEVSPDAWETLGREAGMSTRFARTATAETVADVVVRARDVLDTEAFEGTIAREIVEGIHARGAPWG